MSQAAFDELERVIRDERAENNAKLPVCDQMARGFGVEPCLDKHNGYKCTKPKGHTGGHVAHGAFANILQRWP